MLLFVHGLFAAFSILFVFGALFFDFIALLRPQRFYSYMAALCAGVAILSFLTLLAFGGILASRLPAHSAAFGVGLHTHIWFALSTIILFLIAWFVRLMKFAQRPRLYMYYILELSVLVLAVIAARYGTLLVFTK